MLEDHVYYPISLLWVQIYLLSSIRMSIIGTYSICDYGMRQIYSSLPNFSIRFGLKRWIMQLILYSVSMYVPRKSSSEIAAAGHAVNSFGCSGHLRRCSERNTTPINMWKTRRECGANYRCWRLTNYAKICDSQCRRNPMAGISVAAFAITSKR